MKTKHTPGPWKVEAFENTMDRNGETTGVRVVAPDGTMIADNEDYYPAPLLPQNANLIAAAPDMLEALRWALTELDAVGGCGCGDADCDYCGPYLDARDAIAKATGSDQ